MKPEIEVTFERREPAGMELTINGVTFWMNGSFALLYRMAEYAGYKDKFMDEMKPYYWPKYQAAAKVLEEREQRKREQRESVQENLRLKQNAKRYARRHEIENGVFPQKNAVSSL